jgi:hypothetical protein
MARNRAISSLPNLFMLSAVLTRLPRRQPVRLRERLLGALWAILEASSAALNGRQAAAGKHLSLRQTVCNLHSGADPRLPNYK